MNLYFLPYEIKSAIQQLNLNRITEIRLRCGQPVIIEYDGEYKYITKYSVTENKVESLVCKSTEEIFYAAIDNCIYPYTEQLKRGFVTVSGGVRIGIGGEYVEENGTIKAVKNITSLNVRIPHEAIDCAKGIYNCLFRSSIKSTLIFSKPGLGKTTVLRDLIRLLSSHAKINVLACDERNELSGYTSGETAYDLGENCDVVRGTNKKFAFENAIRAMKPDVFVTDELYGREDYDAVEIIANCNIAVIASTHVIDREQLKSLPFEYFVNLTGIGKEAAVYDKNFNFICSCSTVCQSWDSFIK